MKKALLFTIALAAMSGAAFAQPGPGGGMRGMDANSDGTITRAEFDAGAAQRFSRLDANSDGSIAQAERPQPPAGAPQGGPPGGGRGLANADANNDGTITRAEFDASQSAMFTRLDANHDGSIQAAELPQRPAGAPN